MTTYIRCEQLWQIAIAIAATGGVIFSGNGAVAQIVQDNTVGTTVTPNVDIKGLPSDRIDGGTTRGANLFHSFREFNVREGRGAYFSNPAGIENIFSRVTGNNSSNISGTLGVLGNANLFLLNPNGIIFGPNAKLDVGGSFFASTANSLNFGDGQQFSAKNPAGAPLLTVTVPLGVQFNQEQPRAIVNSGNLSVGTGQNLTLAGGTVVSTGDLSAPGGQVAVAAVPGGSVVNLSSSGQLLNIDTSSSGGDGSSSSSLTELLTNSDEKSYSGLTVNSNGQVELTGAGLSVVDGDVVARNVTAQTATLTANHNLTLVESQLGTTGDLNLLAGDTVRVRDSVANPFVAQAGGQLLVQGRQGVDIFALNNSSSGLVSGGDMVLRSANSVGGDAHYWAGGSFRIEKLDGSLGGLFSPYDPIIRARGDVSFDRYEGASLHIFAGGSVTIPGTVTITGADGTNGLTEDVTLSDGTSIPVNGKNSATLDIRAGIDQNFFNSSRELIPDPVPGIVNPSYGIQPTSANIQIGSINIQSGDQNQVSGDPVQVLLTNQYQPNTNLQGSIRIDDGITQNSTPFSITAYGSSVTISSKDNVDIDQGIVTGISTGTGGDINILSGGNINIGEGIDEGENPVRGSLVSLSNTGDGGNITLSASGTIDIGTIESRTGGEGDGGDITLTANGNITTTGDISSFVVQDANGNGGNITLTSNSGEIDTTRGTISSQSSSGDADTNRGFAGNIILTAAGKIYSGDIEASSNDNVAGGGALVSLKSLQGSVILDRVTLSTTNTGTDFAGIININGKDIQINNSDINNKGFDGLIFIGVEGQVNEDGAINKSPTTANNVTIKDSKIDATRNRSNSDLIITPKEGIQINSNGKIEIENSDLLASTESTAPPGSISLKAEGSIDIKNNSRISIIVQEQARSLQQKIDFTPSIIIQGSSVNITDSTDSDTTRISATTNSRSQKAGDVIVNAPSVLLRGTNPKTNFRDLIQSGKAPQTGLFAQATQGGRTAGNIFIFTDKLRVENGAAATVSSRFGQAGKLEISAKEIFLDNGGLFANTGSVEGGANIFLQGLQGNESRLDELRLQNESLIAANAPVGGSGGNVNINARVLFAFPPTGPYGSDITANAKGGSGGEVIITAKPLSAYGIEYREELTELNDITATSETGPDGIVTLRLPDVDPKRGIIQLSEKLGDSSKLITQSCPVGVSRAASRFVVTGRGGLPPSPTSPLSSDAFVGNASSLPNNRSEQTNSTGSTPVEAQGVAIGPKGEIILTANPSKLTSYRSWQRFTGCNE
ncbi:MAG: filamentous hemagglutinin N-terminal domain-containing protein [Scytonema sp. RU_4_4]|nr:filamentous hemagglutinin N-terminal domain-containing protein [Scytonema sp. RU_4_4]